MKIKRGLVAGLVATFAVACSAGGGPADKLTQACVQQGALNQAACACVSAEVVKGASPAALSALLAQADNPTEGFKAISALSMEDRFSITKAQASAMASCPM